MVGDAGIGVVFGWYQGTAKTPGGVSTVGRSAGVGAVAKPDWWKPRAADAEV